MSGGAGVVHMRHFRIMVSANMNRCTLSWLGGIRVYHYESRHSFVLAWPGKGRGVGERERGGLLCCSRAFCILAE